MTRVRRGDPDLPPGPARDLVDLFRGLRYPGRLTNAQLVARTGLAAGHVSEVLRGWKAPSPDTAQLLAEALGANPDIARRVFDLDTLDRADAITLLRRRAPALAEDDADRLAERLGDLPLALDQAAAYLEQTGMPANGDHLRWADPTTWRQRFCTA